MSYYGSEPGKPIVSRKKSLQIMLRELNPSVITELKEARLRLMPKPCHKRKTERKYEEEND